MARTRKTTRKSTGPFGVPRHQLASRHEGSSSGSNDPIGDLEARVEQLRLELCHRNRAREQDSHRIAELSAEVSRLQYEISEWDTTIDWVVNSRSFAWDCEAKALARVAELSASLESLQVYCNTLHKEVHVLYARLVIPNFQKEEKLKFTLFFLCFLLRVPCYGGLEF
jgi:chromosome segregation ATPase